jgi:hypothetical protein
MIRGRLPRKRTLDEQNPEPEKYKEPGKSENDEVPDYHP